MSTKMNAHLLCHSLLAVAWLLPAAHSLAISRDSQDIHDYEISKGTPVKRSFRKRHNHRVEPRVTALIDAEQTRFLVPVTLGGQTVDLILDTGSANTWAVTQGYSCGSGFSCNFGASITPSDAFTVIEGDTFYTNYGDGTNATGLFAQTEVVFDGVTVPTQSIGLATEIDFTLTDGVWSGLVGLGFSTITTVESGSSTSTYSSLLNTMFVNLLASPVFSLAISRDASQNGGGGYIAIGGILNPEDPAINVSSTTIYAPMIPNPSNEPSTLTNFIMNIDGLSWSAASGASEGGESTSYPYIVDCGTTLSHIPNNDAAAVAALFNPPAQLGASGTYYMVDCDATPPNFSLTVGSVDLPINPADLIIDLGGSQCMVGVQPLISGNELGFIGDTLLRSLLAIFDWGTLEIGLASRPEYDS